MSPVCCAENIKGSKIVFKLLEYWNSWLHEIMSIFLETALT